VRPGRKKEIVERQDTFAQRRFVVGRPDFEKGVRQSCPSPDGSMRRVKFERSTWLVEIFAGVWIAADRPSCRFSTISAGEYFPDHLAWRGGVVKVLIIWLEVDFGCPIKKSVNRY